MSSRNVKMCHQGTLKCVIEECYEVSLRNVKMCHRGILTCVIEEC